MARKFMNKASQSGTTIMDNVKDGIQRLVPDWMGRKDGTYNTEQNHIVFDFETVHNGRRTQTYTPSDGSTVTYGWDDWHNPDIVTDAMKAEKKPRGKPRFPEPKSKYEKTSNQNQEPFEIGLSVRDKTGKWRHKSFMFTPQGINERFSSGKRFEKRSTSFHNMSAGFHLHPEKGTASGSPSRAEQILKHVGNYTMGTGENIPVDWGAIEKWLTGHGVSLDKKTNFIAHNGVFDYPLLERLFTETDADAGTSFLSKLYIDSVDLHGSFPGIKNGEWQREALWNDSKGQTFHNGAYGAESPSTKVNYNHNKRYEIPSNDPDKGAVEAFRRKGDGAHGAYLQDSMLELSRLLGSSGKLDEDDGRIVLRKAQGSGKYYKDSGYYPISYSHLREWEGRGGPLAGTSMDNFREVIGSNAFTEGADNHASRLFQQIADDLNANKNNDFLSDLGLMDSVRALIGDRKDAKPVDCYNAFNTVAGHSGAGDTAFMTEIFFPFMADIMDLFDYTKWSKPELTYLEDGTQRPVEQVREFKASISEFQKRWGNPLGNVPPKPESGERSELADPIVETEEGTYENKFIQRVVDQLGDPTKWVDDEGNEINPLVARWKKKKATEGGEQLHQDNAESHAEPGSEDAHNPDDSPENKSNSEGLNILNQAIENSRSKEESYSAYWDGGPITFAKWKGYIHSERDTDEIEPENRDLIIASVPIGNARVAFRETRRKDARGKITSQFKPFLGITTLVDENDILTTQAISDYAEELLGSSARIPTGQLIGTEISGLLEENLQGIRNHLDGHYSLDHEKLNKFINTPASAWLSEGLKPGTPLTVAAILQKAGVENREEYRQLLQTIWQNYLGEDGIEDHDNTLFSNILSASTPHLAGFLEESNEWLDSSLLEGLEGFNATEISGDELFQTNPEDPTQIGVNLQRLAQLFSSGHEIEGIHPQQFLYDHPDSVLLGWGFDPAIAFTRFMTFMQQVNDGADPVDLLGTEPFYPNAAPIHNLGEPISQTTDDKTFDDPESSDADRDEAANNSVENAGADEDDPKTKVAAPEVVVNAEARQKFATMADESSTKAELDAKVAARIKALKLDASPFITQNYIETVQAQESLAAAYDSLFPPRETAETLDEVSDLLGKAVAYYGRDGEKPSATSLVRELEWIRMNHPSIFSQQEMATALQTNDSESVQGQYLDIMNTAYKAMGDSAGESLSLIQDEQTHMGDRFMGSAHKQFLQAKHVEGLQSNWYDVDDPTTVQEHFAPEPEEEKRSIREIARDMARGAVRVPLEERVMTGAVNALKWYTGWNDLSQQYRDVSSGRTEAGQKLLDAVRRGEKFREVNIGTPEEPQYARTEREYNYYIENIPVGGEAQPSILRQFLQGKKTYGDLADEQEESQAGTIARIRGVFPEQRKWEQQQIAERSAFATTPVTPEQEGRAAESGASGRRAQAAYTGEVKERLEQIREEGSEPGYKQEGGLFVPKSLDKLREYLLGV